jgi:hypothetical protein
MKLAKSGWRTTESEGIVQKKNESSALYCISRDRTNDFIAAS